MPIKKVEIPPGLDRESTQQSSGPQWFDANNVRFRDKFAQTVGGWIDSGSPDMQGIARKIHSWTDFQGNQFTIVGTMWKYYIVYGETAVDITPIRDPAVSVTDKIAVDPDSSIITVTDTAHGLAVNDFVRFTLVTNNIATNITAAILMAPAEGWQVLAVPSDDTFQIQTGVLGDGTGETAAGGSTTMEYYATSGKMGAASGTGWGVSRWDGDDYTPTEYALADPYISTDGTAVALVGNNAAFTAGVFDYVYLTGLTGTSGDLDCTYLNDKWWFVIGDTSGDAKIQLPFTATTGSNTLAGDGSASSAAFHNDFSATPPWSVTGASEGWGIASTSSVSIGAMRTMTIDNFGEDVIVNNRGGPLYYYDTSLNVSSGVPDDTLVLKEINSTNFAGSSNPPAEMDSFLVSQGHGHVIAFGANDIGNEGTQNKMLVRWSDRHNPFTWTPTPSGEAGGDVLRSGSHIMMGVSTKDEIVIFTDTSVYSMRYVGSPEVYGIQLISAGASSYSRQSAIAVDNSVYFMGNEEFYVYNGTVQSLPKNLSNHVFDNMNTSQKDKVFAGVNSAFTEVMWFYPDGNSFECNRYVSYNYANNTWSMGAYDMVSLSEGAGTGSTQDSHLNRTAWEDSSVLADPMSSYVRQYDPAPEDDATFGQMPEVQISRLMNQESGTSANGLDLNAHVESGEVDLDDGYHYAFFDKLIPDVQLFDIEGTVDAELTASMQGRDLPGKTQKAASSITINDFDPASGNATSYSPDFNATTIRGRARSVSIKIESTGNGFSWRTGTMRIRVRPDGKD